MAPERPGGHARPTALWTVRRRYLDRYVVNAVSTVPSRFGRMSCKAGWNSSGISQIRLATAAYLQSMGGRFPRGKAGCRQTALAHALSELYDAPLIPVQWL